MDVEECVARLRLGGRARADAIDELFRRYYRVLAGFFRNHGVSSADAQDLIQQTFVQLVRNVDGFRGECPLSVWLWKIARNTMISHFRSNRAETVPVDDDLPLTADQADPGEPRNVLADCVAEAFRRFAQEHPERADVLRLAVVEGWRTAEIATFLGRTEGATREYVSQCRKHLRPYLEPCYDDG